MFAGLNDFISQLLGFFQWWIVVAPFESVIRIRRGKKVAVLKPGIHFRIPVLDRFFVQRNRKRYMNTPTQAVTTLGRREITVSGGTAYSIVDIAKLYDTLSDPEDVIIIETQSLVASFIADHNLTDINPEAIQRYVSDNLDLEQYGLGDVSFLVTDFVCVKTYRIINSNPRDWTSGSSLNTSMETQARNIAIR